MPRPARHRLALATALTCGLAGLAACSGDDEPTDEPTSSSDAGESPSVEPPYLPVPAGVELSEQGSELAVGESAVVAYQPRQEAVGVLEVTVDRLERTTFKKSFAGWQLSADNRKANPYFVRATVTNRGETDLGGRPVPLYIVDGTDTLIEATRFKSTFAPCTPGEFPKKFPPGRTKKVCLVYLSPDKGDLVAVSFRPTQEFDPITWSGEVLEPEPKKPKGKGRPNR
ncbi:hypothetical protein [Nocardioides sp. SYSU D00038]|uniref:hypothetical protein n=1 Tax=Nocardioides sp. SYSU D00038 TaxID=2812554 RepID=UPI0019679982|nr:hypothetical protein [Nocardioides sp. SYSU D00038]